MTCFGCCRRRQGGGFAITTPLLILFLAAIPSVFFAYLEKSALSSGAIAYHSGGWIRECAKWDAARSRFLVSTFFAGGVSEVSFAAAEETEFIFDKDVAGNASLGLVVDEKRGRILVVYADVVGLRYSAVGAYDAVTGDRIFLTTLAAGPEPSMADDVAVDSDGNAYITDTKANKLWKVSPTGELLSLINNEAFVQRKEWYYNFIGLNGIVYHPNNYLLVIHTSSGYLFKVDVSKETVKVVNVKGSLAMGDGLELISGTKLVVAGSAPSARLVESSDDWETAVVTARYIGPLHRIAASATVKDGMVYLNHLLGGGFSKRTHILAKAVFFP